MATAPPVESALLSEIITLVIVGFDEFREIPPPFMAELFSIVNLFNVALELFCK